MNFLAIAVGGAMGSLLRFWVNSAMYVRHAHGFPWATLTVNAAGSLLIGILFAVIQQCFPGNEPLRLFVITGLLGGFTTFSAFSLETVMLLQNGLWVRALLNIIASVLVCVAAAYVGLETGRWMASQ